MVSASLADVTDGVPGGAGYSEAWGADPSAAAHPLMRKIRRALPTDCLVHLCRGVDFADANLIACVTELSKGVLQDVVWSSRFELAHAVIPAVRR